MSNHTVSIVLLLSCAACAAEADVSFGSTKASGLTGAERACAEECLAANEGAVDCVYRVGNDNPALCVTVQQPSTVAATRGYYACLESSCELDPGSEQLRAIEASTRRLQEIARDCASYYARRCDPGVCVLSDEERDTLERQILECELHCGAGRASCPLSAAPAPPAPEIEAEPTPRAEPRDGATGDACRTCTMDPTGAYCTSESFTGERCQTGFQGAPASGDLGCDRWAWVSSDCVAL